LADADLFVAVVYNCKSGVREAISSFERRVEIDEPAKLGLSPTVGHLDMTVTSVLCQPSQCVVVDRLTRRDDRAQ
jgi:hypothetical protein